MDKTSEAKDQGGGGNDSALAAPQVITPTLAALPMRLASGVRRTSEPQPGPASGRTEGQDPEWQDSTPFEITVGNVRRIHLS